MTLLDLMLLLVGASFGVVTTLAVQLVLTKASLRRMARNGGGALALVLILPMLAPAARAAVYFTPDGNGATIMVDGHDVIYCLRRRPHESPREFRARAHYLDQSIQG